MKQPSFVQSLSGRLLLLGVVPAVLVIAAIVTWNAIDGYRGALQTQERLMAVAAEGATTDLSLRNERWNNFAQVIAATQSSGLFGRRKETLEFVRLANSLTDLNLSAYIVYEKNADGRDAESLKAGEIPVDAMDTAGRYVPVWFDEYRNGVRTGETKLKPSIGMDSLDYYVLPKEQFAKTGSTAPVITEPYEKEGQIVVSHVVPLVNQGKFAGIAGINRSLDILSRIATTIRRRSHGDVFMLSAKGAFIAASFDESDVLDKWDALKDREIGDTAYRSMATLWLSATAAESDDVVLAQDPVLEAECLYAVSRVPVGDWTIVIRRSKSEVMAEANAALRRSIVLGILGVLFVGGMMFLVTRQLTLRVRAAADAADRISQGDLTRTIGESSSSDETGQLMRSMQAMDANLNSLVGNVKQAGIRLNSTATEIAATSKQQEASSATFGAASNQIAAAVKEISATGQDLVKTMESVSKMAAESADLAGSGARGMQGMEGVMRDLDGATASIADKLNAINERSQKITAVITTITKVADQTNILSINAAIEAEKAGEYGSGFLVIAREIRRLADQTASATLDIEQMVRQMQGAVSAGVMEMDRFSDQVRRGVRDVVSAGSQMTEIIDRVNRSTESFKQVNESMQAQSEGAQQISDAMGSLVGNANQTVQSAQEFGRAAADLQSAIGLLRDAVSKFKLRES